MDEQSIPNINRILIPLYARAQAGERGFLTLRQPWLLLKNHSMGTPQFMLQANFRIILHSEHPFCTISYFHSEHPFCTISYFILSILSVQYHTWFRVSFLCNIILHSEHPFCTISYLILSFSYCPIVGSVHKDINSSIFYSYLSIWVWA